MKLIGTMTHHDYDKAQREEREYALQTRRAYLMLVEAIERRYLPELLQEREEYQQWRDQRRFEKRMEKKGIAVT